MYDKTTSIDTEVTKKKETRRFRVSLWIDSKIDKLDEETVERKRLFILKMISDINLRKEEKEGTKKPVL